MHHTLDFLRSGALAGQRRVNLRGRLTEFPRELFDLADTLEVLDLSDNQLSDLPPDLHRLHRLQVLFASGNRFTRVPEAVGRCEGLLQVGFKANRIAELPAQALPPRLRWLTLTDNALAELPDELGRRPLQKLMLAGNRMSRLPDSFAGHATLELLRLAANPLQALPGWLTELPRLSWLALAGHDLGWQQAAPAPLPVAEWAELAVGELLGEGASGLIHRARWSPAQGQPVDVALKLFKGEVTSDGLPEHEMAATLAAGDHANLVGVLARLQGHPLGTLGLLMPLLAAGHQVLAGPPSLASCTRDVYPPSLKLTADDAHALALGVARAVGQLHARGLLHGDLYAHNLHWLPGQGSSVRLGDFGAATRLPAGDAPLAAALQSLEVRAFGVLLDELLALTSALPASSPLPALRDACLALSPRERPTMLQAIRVMAGDRAVS